MDAALVRRLQDQEIHARLVNWGRWLRADNTFAALGFPKFDPVFARSTPGPSIADLDAQHLEHVISTLAGWDASRGPLYAFILKIEYAERPGHALPPAEVRAEYVRRRFNRKCARSTYYGHLASARRAVFHLAGPRR